MPAAFPMATLIYCFYRNASPETQIVRIRNIPGFRLERIVWPGHELVFQAPASAILEVQSAMLTNLLTEVIPCDRLRLQQPNSETPRS